MYINYFLCGRFRSSPSFVNLFHHLFRSIWCHKYLLYTLDYDVIHFSLFSCLVHWELFSSFGHWEIFQLALYALWYISHFFFFEHFCSTTRCSRVILCVSHFCPRFSHFFKKSWFLVLENDTRNQDLDIECARATGVSFLLSPLSGHSKEIYECLLTGVHSAYL